MAAELILKFDPNTIDHLGISLYSKLPSVVSELVSNSWDADANNVCIKLSDDKDKREIYYEDDGEGMTFEELNNKYLLIGRNRRSIPNGQKTKNGRAVIGKKGLGKLSVFGICKEVIVETVNDGLKNKFRMNLEDIKASKNQEYNPDILLHNESTSDSSGTKIWLNDLRRRSSFDPKNLASSLSKKFIIFDQMNVSVQHNNIEPFNITNEMKFDGFKEQLAWIFPNEDFGTEFKYWDRVKGKVFTLETPIKDSEMKGIYLTSRGKIVNNAGFYGLRDTDLFHSYVTGYLEVDFIDEQKEDLISTDRQSLIWENELAISLQLYLQSTIRKIANDWKTRRADIKKQIMLDEKGLDIDDWQKDLPTYERELSDKIIRPILENPSLETDKASAIISSVKDKFENKVYKEYASRIADTANPENIPLLLTLMDEWKTIEAKQYSDLAIARIEVIQQFEEHLVSDTKEVPTLHNFLKTFSWLLDPRILEFRDEVTYSKLLQETFPDTDLDETDRRVDFLCSNALGGVLYVIEIKRSQYAVDEKALEQAFDYGAFLTDRYATQSGFSKVVCYVIGGSKSTNYKYKAKEATYSKTGDVFVKTYRELLEQSKTFHREFIDLYDSSKPTKFLGFPLV